MFRKLVSNLAFSPALISQLGFYARRLRKEEVTRRLGLIFTALALIVQAFSVFQAPEPAHAADPSDMIHGGVHSSDWLMAHYDANTNNFRDMLNAAGINRKELAAAGNNVQRVSSANVYSWGMTPHFGAANGEGSYVVPNSRSGGSRTFYYRPQRLWGNFTYNAFVGHSATLGWFAIMHNCGNLITTTIPPAPQCPPGQVGTYPNCSTPPKPVATCNTLSVSKLNDIHQIRVSASVANGAVIKEYTYAIYRNNSLVKTVRTTSPVIDFKDNTPGAYKVVATAKTSLGDITSAGCQKTFTIAEPERCPQNPKLLKSDPNCQPCPAEPTLWINDQKCSASFIQTKIANNTTQGNVDATTTKAKASDVIAYTLTVKNKGLKAESFTFQDNITDVLQYSTVLNTGGGTVANDTNSTNGGAKVISWPTVTIKPGETQTRIYTMKMNDSIAAASTGTSNPTSYDCRIDNTFGNTVSIAVDCPAPKAVEKVVSQLPHTGPGENIAFAAIVFAVVTFFYARSRQLKKEVRLIRRDFNTGTI